MLKQTDENYNDYIVSQRNTWKLQFNQLCIFKNNLKKKNSFLFDLNSFLVVFDSSTSSTSTSNRTDFVKGSFVPLSEVTISDIVLELEVKGYGTVSWNFYTQKGEVLTINIKKVLHIPNIPTRLISPQQIYQ